MEKVIKFIKKNYILFTVIIAALLIIIVSLVIILLIKNSKNKIIIESKDLKVYEYIDVQKESSIAKISFENKKIVDIKADYFNVYQNGIIYLSDEKELIIPKESMIIFYYQDNLSYKLNKYSELLYKNDSKIVISEGNKIVSDNFFIYDGEDTYILPDASELTINDEKISLSANSYVIASPDSVIYYDYESDYINKINNITKANLKLKRVDIDLLKDVTVYNNNVVLLDKNIKKMAIYKED